MKRGAGMKPLLTVALIAFCLQSCEREVRTALTANEAEMVAWYVEDIAHGLPRDPGELMLQQSSDGMDAIASWATGSRRDDRLVGQPKPLQARLERWGLLARGLRATAVRTTPDGLLRLQDGGLSAAQQRSLGELVPNAVQQENLDRAATFQILLALGELEEGSRVGTVLLSKLLQARIYHAQKAGGLPWTTTATSTLDREATPSTSDQDALRRRDP